MCSDIGHQSGPLFNCEDVEPEIGYLGEVGVVNIIEVNKQTVTYTDTIMRICIIDT